MRKLLPVVLAVCAVALVEAQSAAACTVHDPPAAGEYIKCRYPRTPAQTLEELPTVVRNPQGIDVSQWQGADPNLTGLQFIIVQVNAGFFVNPFLPLQSLDARAHHVAMYGYTFVEPSVSGRSEAQLAHRELPGAKGLFADVEKPGAYQHACEYVKEAKALGVGTAGVYSSVGLWPYSHACEGLLWGAEWGSGPAYPFGGYTRAALKVRQYCGTCFRYGRETDLDESLGLLSIKPAPKPLTTAQRHAIEHQINELRVLLRKHGCRIKPYGRGHYHRTCAIWKAQGNADHRALA